MKVIAGLGTTIDVILRNGILKEGDTLILTGTEGPFTAQVCTVLLFLVSFVTIYTCSSVTYKPYALAHTFRDAHSFMIL